MNGIPGTWRRRSRRRASAITPQGNQRDGGGKATGVVATGDDSANRHLRSPTLWYNGWVNRNCSTCNREYGKRRRCYNCEAEQRWHPKPWLETKSGYYRMKLPGGQQVFYHRWLMEQHLGYTLPEDMLVHHVNHNKTDNRIENLEVMARSLHLSHHKTGQRNGLRGWAFKHTACVQCGTIERPHRGRGLCALCFWRDYETHRAPRSPRIMLRG